MQNIGYIIDKRTNEKVKVLWRSLSRSSSNFYISFKLRTSGNNGVHFEDEEKYLNNNYNVLDELKNGKTIKL